MLGRVPTDDVFEQHKEKDLFGKELEHEPARPACADPENFEESIDRASSNPSTGRGPAQNMLI